MQRLVARGEDGIQACERAVAQIPRHDPKEAKKFVFYGIIYSKRFMSGAHPAIEEVE